MQCTVAIVLLLSGFLAGLEAAADDSDGAGRQRQGYSSPRDALDAMQHAIAKRDWLTVFFSLTPAGQDDAVYDAFYECSFREGDSTLRAVMKRYGLNVDEVTGEYTKKYQEKHGVDLHKLGQLPEVDRQLLREIVLRRVTNKSAFYRESSEALVPKIKDPLAPSYGDLEGVAVSKDAATGWVPMTLYYLKGEPGKPDMIKAGSAQRVERHFRRLNGRWYNGQ